MYELSALKINQVKNNRLRHQSVKLPRHPAFTLSNSTISGHSCLIPRLIASLTNISGIFHFLQNKFVVEPPARRRYSLQSHRDTWRQLGGAYETRAFTCLPVQLPLLVNDVND